MTKPPELKPCPFCGASNSQTVSWVDWSYRVVCHPAPSAGYPFDGDANSYSGCGAMGTGFTSEKDAAAAWNQRSALAPVTPAQAALNEEYATDTIEEIISETHDLDVPDRVYAVNIVAWLKQYHPSALRAIAEGGA